MKTPRLRAADPVRVVEVTAERSADDPPEIPWHLQPPPAQVALQLRTTMRRGLIGAGLARRPELVEAVRNLPGLPRLATSPVGGTFSVSSPAGLCPLPTRTRPQPPPR